MQNRQKIFYLGFHKTGTTSFGAFMQQLGFNSQSYYKPYSRAFALALKNNDFRELFEMTDRFDAFDDDPWYLFYREFEKRYPAARFVFYERDPEKWYQSALLFFGRSTTPMAEYIFGEGKGSPMFNRDHHIAVYRKHSAEVRDYFRDKPEKFLEIPDLSDSSARAVAEFVGRPSSAAIAFPHANVSELSRFEKSKRRYKMRVARLIGLGERYVAEED